MSSSLLSPSSLTANDYNETGCELCRQGLFDTALTCFNNAVDSNPGNATFYFNRSLCFMRMKNFNEALNDSHKCVEINPKHIKAYESQVRCHLVLGNLTAAKDCIENIKRLDKTNAVVQRYSINLMRCQAFLKQYENSMKSNDLISAFAAIVNVLHYSNHSIPFQLMKAEVLKSMKRYIEAKSIVDNILISDTNNHEAYYIRGEIHFCEEDFNSAICDLEKAVHLSAKLRPKAQPILNKAKISIAKKEASEAIASSDFRKAFQLYSRALQIDPSNDSENAKLYFNRSIVVAKLGNIKEAVDNCSEAIELDSSYLKAFLRRAQLCRDLKRFAESVRDYEKAIQLDPSHSEYTELLSATKQEWDTWTESEATKETLTATLELIRNEVTSSSTDELMDDDLGYSTF